MIEATLDTVDILVGGGEGADEEEVAVEGLPDGEVGEDGAEGGEHGTEGGVVGFVDLDPLGDDAAGFEAFAAGFVVFEAEDTGNAGHPGVGGFGDDDVVFAAGGGEEGLCVVDDDLGAWVFEGGAVEGAEPFAGDVVDFG